MEPLARLFVGADLLAETKDGDAIAVRLHQPPVKLGDRVRQVTVYSAPGVTERRMAVLLRQLADKLEGVP
jgi:hypothetical protein